MSLRSALLAALLDGEASGYDLAKTFDASVANFWMAAPQQLYVELDKMAASGLLQSRIVMQERRPNKRLYSLTEAGHEALRQFTATPPKPSMLRDDLLVKVQAADAGDGQAVREYVAERVQSATVKLARYERARRYLLDGRAEDVYLAEAERIGPYLTLMRGIAYEEENIRWAQRVIAVIDHRRFARQKP
jgi:DNA-binding PadR family transcriptional regulator